MRRLKLWLRLLGIFALGIEIERDPSSHKQDNQPRE